MPASVYDIYIEQGATFNLSLVWKDKDDVLVDLTGYTARMHVRKTQPAPTTILDLTTENDGIELGGTSGTISITATAELTSEIVEKKGVYDLELVAADGVVVRLLQGDVVISPEVTR